MPIDGLCTGVVSYCNLATETGNVKRAEVLTLPNLDHRQRQIPQASSTAGGRGAGPVALHEDLKPIKTETATVSFQA